MWRLVSVQGGSKLWYTLCTTPGFFGGGDPYFAWIYYAVLYVVDTVQHTVTNTTPPNPLSLHLGDI